MLLRPMLTLLLVGAASCAAPVQEGAEDGAPVPPNLLLILIDDVGVDHFGAYGEHPDAPRTPHMDALAEGGLLFRNVWANPLCSPTRATILTGRYGFRTGMGGIAHRERVQFDLRPSERTLPRALPAAYRSVLLGKWHLSGRKDPDHPLACGFDRFAGSIGNIGDYRDWSKVVDGAFVRTDVYATTDTTEDCLAFLESAPEPWFVFLSYNAAHRPFHDPPSELLADGAAGERPVQKMRAMVEALDGEVGRVLAALDLERTYVVLASDNGTHPDATTPPFNARRAKGSLGQAGLRVPLVVAGPGVAAGECAAPVNTTDLYATLVELGGGTSAAEDSISLVPYLADPGRAPLRRLQYAETFRPNGLGTPKSWKRALGDGAFKLVHHLPEDTSELYDLRRDPHDRRNLLAGEAAPEHAAAAARLRVALDELVGEAGGSGGR